LAEEEDDGGGEDDDDDDVEPPEMVRFGMLARFGGSWDAIF
jgi:hypothetical protein